MAPKAKKPRPSPAKAAPKAKNPFPVLDDTPAEAKQPRLFRPPLGPLFLSNNSGGYWTENVVPFGDHFGALWEAFLFRCPAWQDARFCTQGLFFAPEELFLFAACNLLCGPMQGYGAYELVQCSAVRDTSAWRDALLHVPWQQARFFAQFWATAQHISQTGTDFLDMMWQMAKMANHPMIIPTGALTVKPASPSAWPSDPC
jgi:hypothetical protein